MQRSFHPTSEAMRVSLQARIMKYRRTTRSERFDKSVLQHRPLPVEVVWPCPQCKRFDQHFSVSNVDIDVAEELVALPRMPVVIKCSTLRVQYRDDLTSVAGRFQHSFHVSKTSPRPDRRLRSIREVPEYY
jgi:hypothetical protein